MAIAFDTWVDGTDNGGTTSTLSWSHTSSGSNRVGLVLILGDSTNGGVDDISGVTWGGAAMTFVTKVGNIHVNTTRWMYAYIIMAPSTGSQTITVTAGSNHYIIAQSVSYTGASQSGQPDASAIDQSTTTSATSLISSLTTVVNNSWIILFEQGYDANLAHPAGGSGGTITPTKRGNNAAFGDCGTFDSGADVTPAGSYSMETIRDVGANIGITHIMISLSPPSGSSIFPRFVGTPSKLAGSGGMAG